MEAKVRQPAEIEKVIPPKMQSFALHSVLIIFVNIPLTSNPTHAQLVCLAATSLRPFCMSHATSTSRDSLTAMSLCGFADDFAKSNKHEQDRFLLSMYVKITYA